MIKIIIGLKHLFFSYLGIIFGAVMLLYLFNLIDFLSDEGLDFVIFCGINIVAIITLTIFMFFIGFVKQRIKFAITSSYSFTIGLLFSIIYILLLAAIEKIPYKSPVGEFIDSWFWVNFFFVLPMISVLFFILPASYLFNSVRKK